MVKQILINLIGNSLKYTFDGKIIVKAELFKKDDEIMVKISVEDTGIGIEKKDFDRVFMLF